MKKTIHCPCGYKFEVATSSKVTLCFECMAKNKVRRGKKPLDVAIGKIDLMIARGELKIKKRG